jgi:hypothetical protein
MAHQEVPRAKMKLGRFLSLKRGGKRLSAKPAYLNSQGAGRLATAVKTNKSGNLCCDGPSPVLALGRL